jgi:hypothetical protein
MCGYDGELDKLVSLNIDVIRCPVNSASLNLLPDKLAFSRRSPAMLL